MAWADVVKDEFRRGVGLPGDDVLVKRFASNSLPTLDFLGISKGFTAMFGSEEALSMDPEGWEDFLDKELISSLINRASSSAESFLKVDFSSGGSSWNSKVSGKVPTI